MYLLIKFCEVSTIINSILQKALYAMLTIFQKLLNGLRDWKHKQKMVRLYMAIEFWPTTLVATNLGGQTTTSAAFGSEKSGFGQ